jgi:hypothetical protein
MPKKAKKDTWIQLSIECDGTVSGTVIKDQNGSKLGMVQRCMVEIDSEKPFAKAYLEVVNVPLKFKNVPVEKARKIAWAEYERQDKKRRCREARAERKGAKPATKGRR